VTLEDDILKEFAEQLAPSSAFGGVDLARVVSALSGVAKPKADEIIGLFRTPVPTVPKPHDDSH
jgi:hypothetical protein